MELQSKLAKEALKIGLTITERDRTQPRSPDFRIRRASNTDKTGNATPKKQKKTINDNF